MFGAGALCAAVIGSMVIRRRNALATTVAVIASVGVLATVPAIGMRMTAARIAESAGIDVMYIDPGVAGYFAPPLFAAFAFLVGDRVLDDAGRIVGRCCSVSGWRRLRR